MQRPYNFTAVPLTVSPPILFQFRQTANLVGGQYTFSGVPTVMTPDQPVNATAMYWFRTLTMSADVGPEDYSGAIATIPTFAMFLHQDAQGPVFYQPVQLGKFLDNLPYEFCIDPATDPNFFLGKVVGVLNNTPALLGKQSITITVILAAQQIMDDAFNASLKAGYGAPL